MSEEVGLARRFRLELNMGSDASPNWTVFPSVAEFQPKYDAKIQDTSVYDSNGAMGNTITAFGWGLELKVLHLIDDTTGVENPVHAAVRLAADAMLGANKKTFRWYDRTGGPEAYQGRVVIQWEPDGGKVEDLNSVKVTLTGDGVRTTIANPLAVPPPVAAVTALSPATGPAAGGTLVKISGTAFVGVTGAAGVKFGSTNAASYFVEDSTTIYATAPAVAASTVNVRVTNSTATMSPTATANQYVYV